jgi:hypothetical protein
MAISVFDGETGNGSKAPHPDTLPGAQARAAEFHPQLYNLAIDPGERCSRR